MPTFREFREELATSLDLYHRGVVESFTTTTLVDTDALARFTGANQLVGGTVWVASEDATGYLNSQWRHITGYDESTQTISIEYDWSASSPVAGEIYEVFMALTPAQWGEAINQAIRSAWPSVFEVKRVNPSGVTGESNMRRYTFTEEFDSVLELRVEDTVNYPGWGARPVPKAAWIYDSPMTTNGQGTLSLLRPLNAAVQTSNIHAYVNGRYPTYSTFLEGTYPPMDQAYLKAQAQANAYGMLAAATQNQAHVSNHQVMANYWQEIAGTRKAELAAALTGADMSKLVK